MRVQLRRLHTAVAGDSQVTLALDVRADVPVMTHRLVAERFPSRARVRPDARSPRAVSRSRARHHAGSLASQNPAATVGRCQRYSQASEFGGGHSHAENAQVTRALGGPMKRHRLLPKQ